MQTVGRKGPYGVRDGLQVVGGHWLTWGLELGQGNLRDVEGWSKYQRILPLPNGFVFVNLPAFSLSLFFFQNHYGPSAHLYMPSWILNISN